MNGLMISLSLGLQSAPLPPTTLDSILCLGCLPNQSSDCWFAKPQYRYTVILTSALLALSSYTCLFWELALILNGYTWCRWHHWKLCQPSLLVMEIFPSSPVISPTKDDQQPVAIWKENGVHLCVPCTPVVSLADLPVIAIAQNFWQSPDLQLSLKF